MPSAADSSSLQRVREAKETPPGSSAVRPSPAGRGYRRERCRPKTRSRSLTWASSTVTSTRVPARTRRSSSRAKEARIAVRPVAEGTISSGRSGIGPSLAAYTTSSPACRASTQAPYAAAQESCSGVRITATSGRRAGSAPKGIAATASATSRSAASAGFSLPSPRKSPSFRSTATHS